MPVVQPENDPKDQNKTAGSLYLNNSKIAVFGVCTQVKDVPFHINGCWKTECDKIQHWTIAMTLKPAFFL